MDKIHLRFKETIRWYHVVLGLGALALLYYVYISDPTSGPILPCPLHATTGLYCPGCGMSRAVHSLMHGDVLGVLGYNPLLFLLIPLAGYSILKRKREDHRVTWLLLLLVVSFGILRNIIPLLQP